MKRVISLARLSTEEQAAEGRAGLLRQRTDIESACRHHDLQVVRGIELIGVSGTEVLLNAEFQDMLRDVTRADIDGVVCSAIDRLTRPETLGDLAVFDPFQRFRKIIYTPQQVLDPATDSGFLMAAIQGAFGGIERVQILRRMQSGKEENRKRGRHAGPKLTLPRGIDFDFKKGQWSWVEPWASRIQRAFDMLLQHRPVRAIALEIGGYTDRGLAIALRNPVWIGTRRYEFRRGEKYISSNGNRDRYKIRRDVPLNVDIDIEPLISQETWERAQEILMARGKGWKDNRPETSRFLVKGIMRCGCGEPMYTRGDTRAGKHDYYYCRSRHPKGTGCGSPVIWREHMDTTVERIIEKVLLDPEVLMKVAKLGTVSATSGRNNSASLELQKLQAKRKRLIDMAVDGIIARDEYLMRVRELEQSIREMQALLPAEDTKRDEPRDILMMLANVFAEFAYLSFGDKRAVLNRTVRDFTVSGGAIPSMRISTRFMAESVCKTRTRIPVDSSETPPENAAVPEESSNAISQKSPALSSTESTYTSKSPPSPTKNSEAVKTESPQVKFEKEWKDAAKSNSAEARSTPASLRISSENSVTSTMPGRKL